jgi:hypothetical protein
MTEWMRSAMGIESFLAKQKTHVYFEKWSTTTSKYWFWVSSSTVGIIFKSATIRSPGFCEIMGDTGSFVVDGLVLEHIKHIRMASVTFS